MTPSARQWGTECSCSPWQASRACSMLLIRKDDELSNRRHIPPIHANLRGLPPVLFSVGTCDALLDDSFFMAPRRLAGGNIAELALYPGACHGFLSVPIRSATRPSPAWRHSPRRISRFLSPGGVF